MTTLVEIEGYGTARSKGRLPTYLYVREQISALLRCSRSSVMLYSEEKWLRDDVPVVEVPHDVYCCNIANHDIKHIRVHITPAVTEEND